MNIQFFTKQDVQFAYEIVGEGETVVFCHGLGGDRSQPIELFVGLNGYRLISMDARGHGDTHPVGPSESFSFQSLAEDLRDFADHLGLDRFVLGGISMGAGISTSFVSRFPERVQALVLVRPAWLAEPNPPGLALLPMIASLLRESGPEVGFQRLFADPRYQSLAAQHPDAEEAARLQFGRPQAADRSPRLERMTASAPIEGWDRLPDSMPPTLVIANHGDFLHPYEYAVAWADHIPGAKLVTIPAKNTDWEGHKSGFQNEFTAFLNALNGGT